MLSFFRQRGLSNVLYGAIIAATILTFVIEFRPNATNRTASLREVCAARVRGRCIEPRSLSSAYRLIMPTHRGRAAKQMNLKRAALDGLIERELLDDEAKRLGLAATADEVTDQLYAGFVRVSVPAADPTAAQAIFQDMYQSYAQAGLLTQDVAQAHMNDRDAAIPVDFRDPKTKSFDLKAYTRQVRSLSNLSTAEFRDEQALEILAEKMRDVVRDPIRVSEGEAWHEYERRYSTAIVTSIAVKEAWAARWAVDAKPADVAGWASDHKADIDEALAQRKAQDTPKAGHIRHILVKVPYGATDAEKGVALSKLAWAVQRIKDGEAFAEVARDVSEDTGSAAQGGDVGDKTEGFVPEFRAAADGLKTGETTAGAVQSQYGYHYITKDDPAKATEVEALVGRSVARSLFAKSKAIEAAQRIATKIDEALRDGKSDDDAVSAGIAAYAKAGAGKVARLRVLPPPATPAAVDAGAAKAGPLQFASTDAGAAPPKVNTQPPDMPFNASADSDRPKAQTSSEFNQGGDPFPGLSPDGTANVVAFSFSAKEGAVLPDPVRTPDGFAVVRLRQRKTATREQFDKDRATLEQELVRAKRDEAMSLYVKGLRAAAKDDLKIDDSYVAEAKVDGGAGGAPEDEDEY
ncbi:MAG TPA: peptidylprolyl isomerase [Polyangiaceae bacterium]|nr:peptidylprolyl isomerase [Polyangiaceae bacterium]